VRGAGRRFRPAALLLGALPGRGLAPAPRPTDRATEPSCRQATAAGERLCLPELRSPLPRPAALRGLQHLLPLRRPWRPVSILRRGRRLPRAHPTLIEPGAESKETTRQEALRCPQIHRAQGFSTLSPPDPPYPQLLPLLSTKAGQPQTSTTRSLQGLDALGTVRRAGDLWVLPSVAAHRCPLSAVRAAPPGAAIISRRPRRGSVSRSQGRVGERRSTVGTVLSLTSRTLGIWPMKGTR
jgi:hypothetical protein